MEYAIFWWSSKTVGVGTKPKLLGNPKFVPLDYALYSRAPQELE